MESKEGQKSTELFEISSKKKEILSPAWLHSRLETPPTPGRPLFSFRAGNLHRKSFPSKWDNAEKWLVRSSGTQPSLSPNDSHKTQVFNPLPEPNPTDTLLKDKFTCSAEKPALSVFSCSETSKGGILLKDSVSRFETRDVGTEITPICSLSASICHTPMKSSSPVRHNTPADLSGPLVAASTKFDISELNDCHFAKLELSAQYDSFAFNWSSREEEEEEVSKSLRHFELNNERKNMAESRASFWENEERAKSCIRYQREEAKIQAWVNLQTAKAEEKSRKLEVKIQKMRSSLEEKLMKRMAVVHRRAEEWRAEAQLQHSQQILKTAEDELALKMHNRASYLSHHINASCANCFPMQQ